MNVTEIKTQIHMQEWAKLIDARQWRCQTPNATDLLKSKELQGFGEPELSKVSDTKDN